MIQEGGNPRSAPEIALRKKIVQFDESSPAEEPLFVNYVQVAHAAGSAYIDVGVISLDDMLQPSREATFLVLNRLVMSKETIAALGQQISELLSNENSEKQS